MTEPAYEIFYLTDVNYQSGRVKRRKIYRPNEAMSDLQKSFIASIENKIPPLLSATGSIKGASPLKNVLLHKQGRVFPRYFYLLDLKNAYQSVKIDQLVDILAEIDKSRTKEFFQEFLSRYCTSREGGLVTGGNASPLLFNLYCEFLIDRPLREHALRSNLTYTRYLDDLTFSADTCIGAAKRRKIRQIINDASFAVSHLKSQVLDLHQGAITINGIRIELSGKISLPPAFTDRLIKLLLWANENISNLGRSDINLIYGNLSVFKHFTKNKKLNRAERRIVDLSEYFHTYCIF